MGYDDWGSAGGFGKLPNELRYHEHLSPDARLTYAILCLHRNTDQKPDIAFPSVVQLAAECRFSRQRAIRGLRELEDWGMIVTIERHRGKKRNNEYFMVRPAEWEPTPAAAAHIAKRERERARAAELAKRARASRVRTDYGTHSDTRYDSPGTPRREKASPDFSQMT